MSLPSSPSGAPRQGWTYPRGTRPLQRWAPLGGLIHRGRVGATASAKKKKWPSGLDTAHRALCIVSCELCLVCCALPSTVFCVLCPMRCVPCRLGVWAPLCSPCSLIAPCPMLLCISMAGLCPRLPAVQCVQCYFVLGHPHLLALWAGGRVAMGAGLPAPLCSQCTRLAAENL